MDAVTVAGRGASITAHGAMYAAGQAANTAAAANVFADFCSRRAANTLIAHRGDLDTFARYLCEVTGGADCPDADALQTTGDAWQGVTWGIVAGYLAWQLQRGYATNTASRRLSTVKVYAGLAGLAGAIDAREGALIQTVHGYDGKDAKSVDRQRAQAGAPTRKGHKKALPTRLTAAQAKALKAQPDRPQGRRDALLMALLLDHGLRAGEVGLLTLASFDLGAGTVTFWRPKVDLQQTHKLSAATLRALRAWIDAGECPAMGPILRGSRKGGALLDTAMTLSAIAQRVRALGAAAGIDGLSPHDCRHYWASHWAREVSEFRLQEAGGWASMATVRRYVERAAIANEGMDAGDD